MKPTFDNLCNVIRIQNSGWNFIYKRDAFEESEYTHV